MNRLRDLLEPRGPQLSDIDLPHFGLGNATSGEWALAGAALAGFVLFGLWWVL